VGSAAPTPAWDTYALEDEAGDLVGATRARVKHALVDRDRWASLFVGGSYLAVALLLFMTHGLAETSTETLAVAVVCIGTYALAARVEFEVGTGAALPTQLVLVPMLFMLPLGLVPACVSLGLMLAYLRREKTFDRLLLLLTSSWHAIGPVAVFVLTMPSHTVRPGLTDAGWYLVAFAAQIAFDFSTHSVREWFGLGIRPTSRGFAGWVYAVDAALAPIGLFVAFVAVDHPAAIVLILPLVALLLTFARERGQRIDAALELGHAYRGTALLLGDVVEADDAYTGEHSRDVVSLTLDVAKQMRLDARQSRTAEFVALLHDVGKIRIPPEIINKAGPLDPDERKIIETHTVEGEAMLSKIGGLLGEVGSIVRSCHERWDGAGYPDGLAGEKIPLIARIVCTTDAYSAMTTDRPYREARSPEEALAELRRCAGTQFDPRVVDAVDAVVSGG
jgi:HD-GYP domain-containing protein (c-di-GMP phosphodiesterase class II)